MLLSSLTGCQLFHPAASATPTITLTPTRTHRPTATRLPTLTITLTPTITSTGTITPTFEDTPTLAAVPVYTPGAMKTVKNIPYAQIPGTAANLISLDVYKPSGAKNLPVILFVHGGGWVSGDKGGVGTKPQAITDRGFIFVSTNYRLSPAVKYPAHLRDLAQAIAWVYSNIASYGGNPERIFLLGHSAGAVMVAEIATDERYLVADGLTLNTIKGVIALDASYDFAQAELDEPGRVESRIRILGLDPAGVQDASPVNHVAAGKGIPPFLLVYAGDWKMSQDGSVAFAKVLQAAGIPAQTYHAANRNHTSVALSIGAPGDQTTNVIFSFLAGIH